MENLSFKLMLVCSALFLNFNNTFSAATLAETRSKSKQRTSITEAEKRQNSENLIMAYVSGDMQKALQIVQEKELSFNYKYQGVNVYNYIVKNPDATYAKMFNNAFIAKQNLLEKVKTDPSILEGFSPDFLRTLLALSSINPAELIRQNSELDFKKTKNSKKIISKVDSKNFIEKFKKGQFQEALNMVKKVDIDLSFEHEGVQIIALIFSTWNEKYSLQFIDAIIKKQNLLSMNDGKPGALLRNVKDPMMLDELLKRGLNPNIIWRKLSTFDAYLITSVLSGGKIKQDEGLMKHGLIMIQALLNYSDPNNMGNKFDANLLNEHEQTPLMFLSQTTTQIDETMQKEGRKISKATIKFINDVTQLLMRAGADPFGKKIENPIVLNAIADHYRELGRKEELEKIENQIKINIIRQIKYDINNDNFEHAKFLIDVNTQINGNEAICLGANSYEDHGHTILDDLVQNLTNSNPYLIAIFNTLLERHVNLDHLNAEGEPAIFYATPFATQLLLDLGASHSIKNINGKSLLDTWSDMAYIFSARVIVERYAEKALILLNAKEKDAITPEATKALNEEIQAFVKNGGKFAQYVMSLKDLEIIAEDARRKIDIDNID